MILYDHPLSSYAQKVKIALREKGVAFERMLPDDFGTGRRDTAFAAVNPRGEVPVLLPDGKTPIFESTVILEYIEERWPEPRLLPADPLARAYARMTEEVCDTQYEAVNWGFGELLWFRRAEGALAETLKATAARDTQALQLKLDELIRVNEMARNSLISLEDRPDSEVVEVKLGLAGLVKTDEMASETASA